MAAMSPSTWALIIGAAFVVLAAVVAVVAFCGLAGAHVEEKFDEDTKR